MRQVKLARWKRSQLEDAVNPPHVVAHLLNEDGEIPNNSRLALLLYQNVIKLPEEDPASLVEQLFESNQWTESWRNGIYRFHHYHSTAHEALGCFNGSATVQFGGENGIIHVIRQGDVVIIPAGVAHKNLESSTRFGIVGAYPAGQNWDMCYGERGERPSADRQISQVPLPKTDPVYGKRGPLLTAWAK